MEYYAAITKNLADDGDRQTDRQVEQWPLFNEKSKAQDHIYSAIIYGKEREIHIY